MIDMPRRLESFWRGDMLWEKGALHLWVYRVPHNIPYPQHHHDFLEIVLVMGGRCIHHSVLGRHPIHRGDVVILRPGTWHALEDAHRLVLWQCCLGPDLLQHELLWMRQDPKLNGLLWGVSPGHDIRGVTLLKLPRAACERLAELFGRMYGYQEADPSSCRVARVGLLLLALAEIGAGTGSSRRRSVSVPPVALRAAELLQMHYAEDWSLDRLVDRLGISKFYLARLFRAGLGVSPMAYLNRIRAEAGAAMVRDTPLSLGEIGAAVGWSPASHFSRRFRGHLGMSPLEYRRRFARARNGATPRSR